MYRDQMAERIGSRAVPNDVSLGKALHPTLPRGNVPVLTVSCSVC